MPEYQAEVVFTDKTTYSPRTSPFSSNAISTTSPSSSAESSKHAETKLLSLSRVRSHIITNPINMIPFLVLLLFFLSLHSISPFNHSIPNQNSPALYPNQKINPHGSTTPATAGPPNSPSPSPPPLRRTSPFKPSTSSACWLASPRPRTPRNSWLLARRRCGRPSGARGTRMPFAIRRPP